ncbi:MAG: type II secretion system GspH family protein, partial [Verrucomicrobiae bacterium]|nr:type II secretion system GspH family protein [Verrucomicrobiae bacterium]
MISKDYRRNGVQERWPGNGRAVDSPVAATGCLFTGQAGGFTLIEFIGVLAILTIIGTIVTENVLARIARQVRETEASNLAAFGDALRKSIIRTKRIQGAGELPAQMAEELALPVSQVVVNRQGYTRYFFVHPEFRVGLTNSSGLPYVQSVDGSQVEPANCKVLLISSAGPIPDGVIPEEINTAVFTNLWNVGDQWDALARDVKIHRVELRDLFHRVILSNLDPIQQAIYAVGNVRTNIPPGTYKESWFIDTTALDLHMADGTLQTTVIVREDVSYVFENGRWNRHVTMGRRSPSATRSFGGWVEQFLNVATNPGSKFSAEQQDVVNEMYNFLWYVAAWAEAGFPTDERGGSPRPQIPEWRVGYD